MRNRASLLALCLLLGPAACAKAPAPGPAVASPVVAASPLPGGFTAVPTDDARLRAAVEEALAQLRGPGWLGRPDLAAGPITAGERQVVMGTHHRATLELSAGGARRLARLLVAEDLLGRFTVLAVDLGPVGAAAPLLDTPAAADVPGGWTDQPPGDADVVKAADQVRALLAGDAWLGRPVEIVDVVAARTQVVAGLNTYLALDVRVDGFAHGAEAIMYAPLEGAATLSWVRLAAARMPGWRGGMPPGRGGMAPW